jgi:hypothetical protein
MSAGVVDRLNLDGDDAAFELIPELAESFGVSFEREISWTTAVDILKAIEERLPPSAEAGLCATSMTFYRLRRAVRDELGLVPLPSTPLTDVLGARPFRTAKRLAAASGFRIGPPSLTWRSGVGCLTLVAAATAFYVESFWAAPLLAAIVGLALIKADPRRYAEKSFGEWVRSVSRQNAGLLMRAGADRRSEAIWSVIKLMLQDVSGVPADQIGPETALWPQEKKRAA